MQDQPADQGSATDQSQPTGEPIATRQDQQAERDTATLTTQTARVTESTTESVHIRGSTPVLQVTTTPQTARITEAVTVTEKPGIHAQGLSHRFPAQADPNDFDFD